MDVLQSRQALLSVRGLHVHKDMLITVGNSCKTQVWRTCREFSIALGCLDVSQSIEGPDVIEERVWLAAGLPDHRIHVVPKGKEVWGRGRALRCEHYLTTTETYLETITHST